MEPAQLQLWRSATGDDYVRRNPARPQVVRLARAGFIRVFRDISPDPDAILEVGANLGINLRALRGISAASLHAVEPNQHARRILVEDQVIPPSQVHDGHAGALPFDDAAFDLVFTNSVLMCIPDEHLGEACAEIHRVSRRWILSIEYPAARPVTLPYHGYDNMVFKRDYRTYWCHNFAEVTCIAQGPFLALHRRLEGPTWWLLEKPKPPSTTNPDSTNR